MSSDKNSDPKPMGKPSVKQVFAERWPRLPVFLTTFQEPIVENWETMAEYEQAVRVWDAEQALSIARSSGAERLPSLLQAGANLLAQSPETFPLEGMQEWCNRGWNESVEDCRAWFAWILELMAEEYARDEAHWAHFSLFLRHRAFLPNPIEERILAAHPSGTTYEDRLTPRLQFPVCQQVAREYGQSVDLATIQLVLQEGREVLKRGATFPHEHIFDIHPRSFGPEAIWRAYLTGLLDVLEEELRKREG